MDRDGRLQTVGRLPGTEAHPGDELADPPGGLQRHRYAVAGQQVALRRQSAELDLQALQGRVHVTHRATDRALLAQHMPRLKGLAQFQLDAIDGVVADLGKAELQVRRKPLCPHLITGGIEIDDNVGEILVDKVRQQEPVMQLRAPARQFWWCIWLAPEPCDQRPQQ
ncbi:hypothetical protein D9M73_171860 [compost metagenome]